MAADSEKTVLGIRPCTAVWLFLMALTVVTYAAGWMGITGTGLIISVLIIAIVKAQLVADSFMGLRRVRGFWRPLITGYLLTVGGLIAVAFMTAG